MGHAIIRTRIMCRRLLSAPSPKSVPRLMCPHTKNHAERPSYDCEVQPGSEASQSVVAAPEQPRWAVARALRASCREARTPALSVERALKKRAATAESERKSAGARAASWPMAWYVKPRSADDAASVPASSSAAHTPSWHPATEHGLDLTVHDTSRPARSIVPHARCAYPSKLSGQEHPLASGQAA